MDRQACGYILFLPAITSIHVGSGKTFTMTSIYDCAAKDLFSNLDREVKRFADNPPTVTVSFFEVAGDHCHDLLNGFCSVQLVDIEFLHRVRNYLSSLVFCSVTVNWVRHQQCARFPTRGSACDHRRGAARHDSPWNQRQNNGRHGILCALYPLTSHLEPIRSYGGSRRVVS